MTLAYFDCASGISGDMFLGALVDAGLPIRDLAAAIESLGIEGLTLSAAKVTRLGISATKVDVVAPHEHAHRHLSDIEAIIDASGLSDATRDRAKRIFQRVAAAEAKVHNTSIHEVHFHEVGALDSIADIVGAAAGIELLGIDRCVFSGIAVGSGTVKSAHGVLPVPAPATAEILIGVPIRETGETGELATPTGAAIARELAEAFAPLPGMTIRATGYGAGTREGKTAANVLRVFIGDASADATPHRVLVVETAIDDMTGEAISYATQMLFAAGALDVFVTPIFMKKGRPASLVTVLADEARKDAVMDALFRETTTFGARMTTWDRETLDRQILEVESEYGPFRLKVGSRHGRIVSATPEYDDARRIAERKELPFKTVYAALQAVAGEYLEGRRTAGGAAK